MIIRTWQCLNRRCLHRWDGEGDHPKCINCGGLHVKWIPGGFAIKSERTRNVDATVAQLQTVYGDKNYRSPRRDEAVAPKVNPPVAPGKTQRFEPMTGWAVNMPIDQQGRPVSICAPTGVTAKVQIDKSQLGAKVGSTKVGATTIGVGGKIEASHKGTGR